jgi:DNA-binding transcriptional regulator GbsR (MarR family)
MDSDAMRGVPGPKGNGNGSNLQDLNQQRQKAVPKNNSLTSVEFLLISVNREMKLDPVIEKLVLHWGEMGSRWGVSRMVAQIHALLYFSPKPMTADEIVEALGVARSHVSNSLKDLQSWGVVKVVRVLGDRREYFQSIQDVWQLFEILLDERKRREMDPTLKMLRETQALLNDGAKADTHTQERLREMLEFFELMDGWFGEVRRLPLASRVKLVKWGRQIRSWLQ